MRKIYKFVLIDFDGILIFFVKKKINNETNDCFFFQFYYFINDNSYNLLQLLKEMQWHGEFERQKRCRATD